MPHCCFVAQTSEGTAHVIHAPVTDRNGRTVAVLGARAVPTSPKSAFNKFDLQHVVETAGIASSAVASQSDESHAAPTPASGAGAGAGTPATSRRGRHNRSSTFFGLLHGRVKKHLLAVRKTGLAEIKS